MLFGQQSNSSVCSKFMSSLGKAKLDAKAIESNSIYNVSTCSEMLQEIFLHC